MPTGILHARGRNANCARRENRTKKHGKQFNSLALCALLLAGFLLGGCSAASSEPKRYERVFFDVFDTVTTVILYDTSESRANERFDELHALLQDYHRLYDIYNAYEGLQNLYSVNQNAGIAPVAVDARILGLVDYARRMDALTSGRMNIAMGGVLAIWQSFRDAGQSNPDQAALPPMAQLEAANAHSNLDSIVVDRAAGTLYITDAQTQIDVGAVAKGYAAQKATEAMEQSGVASMLLSVGGNVCSIGARPDGTLWQVGIQDPYSDGNLCVVAICGQSVVTSGTYERYYTVNGRRYHHIIDPATLMPSTYYDSVTVIAKDSALADALTTGLFCMPIEDATALVDSLEGVAALWVLPDGTMVRSSGFSAHVAE